MQVGAPSCPFFTVSNPTIMARSSPSPLPRGCEIVGEITSGFEEILNTEALEFVAKLERRFRGRREECVRRRQEQQISLDRGAPLGFLAETRHVREGDWSCGPIPSDIADRRVEITGPTDRKMVINALNSGAKVFMADFEDANSPMWANMVQGQINLRDAIRHSIHFTSPEGKEYKLKEHVAVITPRPRG